MQHDEKTRKSLSQFREEILARHDIFFTRELLSTEDHLRFYLMRFWLDIRDWFGVWPMFLFFLLFVVSIYLLAANNLMVGNWGFLLVALMFALVSIYGTAKLGDLQHRQRKDDYLKAVRRMRVFLVAKAKDGLCMRKLIKLYSGVIKRADVSYSKDAVAIRPKPARLPKIEEHRLLSFIFVDLGRKSKGSDQYFRDKNLFLKNPTFELGKRSLRKHERFRGWSAVVGAILTFDPKEEHGSIAKSAHVIRGMICTEDLDSLRDFLLDCLKENLIPENPNNRLALGALLSIAAFRQQKGYKNTSSSHLGERFKAAIQDWAVKQHSEKETPKYVARFFEISPENSDDLLSPKTGVIDLEIIVGRAIGALRVDHRAFEVLAEQLSYLVADR